MDGKCEMIIQMLTSLEYVDEVEELFIGSKTSGVARFACKFDGNEFCIRPKEVWNSYYNVTSMSSYGHLLIISWEYTHHRTKKVLTFFKVIVSMFLRVL